MKRFAVLVRASESAQFRAGKSDNSRGGWLRVPDGKPMVAGEIHGELGKSPSYRHRTDLAKYVDLCARGEFYRYVESESGLKLDYDALKQQIFTVLFGRNGRAGAVYQVLDRRFSSLMTFIRRVKRGNHCRLAHLGQRAESDFIFGRVVSRLLRERPELFIATIHDSVLTTVGDEQYVRGVMLEEFRTLGIEPTVRVEK